MQSPLSLINLSHHAYCLITHDSFTDTLVSFLEKEHSIVVHGNPDYFLRKYETFTIDNAKEIITFHNIVPTTNTKRKIIILYFDNVTVEAQNALLKLLEESADYANFFIIIPSSHLLLDTVKSRMQVVKINSEDNEELVKAATSFLGQNISKRLEFVKNTIEEINKEKKTKQYLVEFLNCLQGVVRARGVAGNMKSLEAIELARKYIGDRAPSLKMLMEYVAVTISP